MKSYIFGKTNLLRLVAGIALSGGGFIASDVAARAEGDPRVFPIQSTPYGRSYGQWAVAQIQWTMSIPIATSPWATDTTGEFAGIGQSGPVWFLGGSLGGSFTRRFNMPAGKAIFVPVNLWIFGATAFDCDPSNPGVVCDIPSLITAAAAAADSAVLLEVDVDGQPIRQIQRYRATSPAPFSVTVPEDNISSVPAGTYYPQVADGYFLILKPLRTGEHTIRVRVINANGFEGDLIYNINVVPSSQGEQKSEG
jgi:hypothetical protein